MVGGSERANEMLIYSTCTVASPNKASMHACSLLQVACNTLLHTYCYFPCIYIWEGDKHLQHGLRFLYHTFTAPC